jgi:hypothetical protein
VKRLKPRLAKAYELFVRAYGECRQAVLYLRRREGDADLIAPRSAAADPDASRPTSPRLRPSLTTARPSPREKERGQADGGEERQGGAGRGEAAQGELGLSGGDEG